ncbi:MAG: DUF1571 domain-containing protein [Gemmataceae bacterium]|nr:DUF1571 domain-containing protein [Gemmataceae bacterium]
MSLRGWTRIGLAVLLLGCTRYGVNPPGGPFARKDGRGSLPPDVAWNDGEVGGRGRLGEAVIPAGGRFPDRRPLLPRRRSGVADALPSPYAQETVPPSAPTADTPSGSRTTPWPPAGPPPAGAVPPLTPPPPLPSSPPPASASGPPLASPAAPSAVPPSAGTPTPAPSPAPPPAPQSDSAAPTPGTPADAFSSLRQLLQTAQGRWATIHTYEAIAVRRELAPNKQRTYDRVFYLFRKEPFSVYMRNLDEANAGRELLYNPKQHGDKIYAIVGKADEGLLYKAGQRAPAVSPDFPMVKQKSRYSIREAGLGTPIQRVGQWLEKAERGQIPPQNLRFQPEVRRPECPDPLHLVELQLRPGDDPLFPQGGRRQWYFHANPQAETYALPILIRALDADGQEVEYYWIERLQPNVRLTDADFHPDRLGSGKTPPESRTPKRPTGKK